MQKSSNKGGFFKQLAMDTARVVCSVLIPVFRMKRLTPDGEKYKGKIFMWDSMRDSFCVALKHLGYSVNTTNEKEINEAKELLIKQKYHWENCYKHF